MNIQSELNKDNHSIWTGSFILLSLSNFFLFFGAEMLSPVLPVHIFHNGGTNTQIGLVMGSFTFTAIFIRLLAVKMTELLGQRIFLIAGLFICVLAPVGYYMWPVLLLIFFLRIFHGLGFGAATTLYGALVSYTIPKSRMGEGMGIFGMGVTIAIAIGPFLGATAASGPNYEWTFLFSSGLIFTAAILTKISTTGRETVDRINKPASKISMSDFLETRALMPSILAFFMGVSFAGIFTYIALFSNEVGIKRIGIFFLINSLAEFLVRPMAGRIYDIRGHLPVIVPGAIICGAGTIMLSMTTNLPMLIAASSLYGIGVGGIFPVLEAWALKSVGMDRRVAANATFFNFTDVGIGIGSVMLGLIAQASSYACMYFYSALIFIPFLIIYLIYYYKYFRAR